MQQSFENSPKKLNRSRTFNSEDNSIKWGEFKIEGSNITSRAYPTVSILENTFYVYGGYQVSQGILSSFYSMELNKPFYKWVELINKQSPGPLMKHSSFIYQGSIYLQGGLTSTSVQTNLTWRYDIKKNQWDTLPVNETYPQPFDNHSSVMIGDEVAIFGGFYSGNLGNTLYIYDIKTNIWRNLSEGLPKHQQPTQREGCGMTYGDRKIYLFGGTNGMSRLNDLWFFNLEKKQWHKVHYKSELYPSIRNGFTLDFWNNKLVLFGGIHDITWEMDDLWICDVKMQTWRLLEEDSTRRVEQGLSPLKGIEDVFDQTSKSNRRTQFGQSNSMSPMNRKFSKKKKLNVSPAKSRTQVTEVTTDGDQKRHHTLDEQRKKEFETRKLDMLKQFEVPESQQEQLRSMSPTSENMRNSLLLIGNPQPTNKFNATKFSRLTDFGKESISKINQNKFMQPLKNVSNTFLGKRPCARDGHKSIIYHNYLLIFGGDRHQMSFNDVYGLDLNSLE